MSIPGKTIRGSGLGKKIGFPTLNLRYSGEEEGVYVAEARIGGETYGAAVNLGGRPTVDDKKFCEVHLLDFGGEIKEGTEIEVELLHKIRAVKKFPDLEQLKRQIAKDVEFAKNWYNARKER